MTHRCYAPTMTAGDVRVILDPDESAHLSRVLRLREGDEVRVFDGRGAECAARVSVVDRARSELEVVGTVTPVPEPRVRTTLGLALLKADKFDAVLRDAVMLGVCAVQPLATARTDVPASAFSSGGRLDRWRRIAVASAKQSGRAVVPAVREPAELADCLEADRSSARLLLAEPSVPEAEPLSEARSAWADLDSALVLVGPEGGWTSDEISIARARGCQLVSLGPRTLRADAAPVVALSVLQFLWGEM